MYEELTNLIPFITSDNADRWISDIDNDRKIKWIESSVNEYERKYDNPVFHHYDDILVKNGISWNVESFIHMDVSKLNDKVVLALLIGSVRSKPFGDTTVETLLECGLIRKWLLRLKEIDFTYVRRDVYDITITSCSGLVGTEKEYKDELHITTDDIYYKYESENNPYHVWFSKMSERDLFDDLIEAALTIIYCDKFYLRICDAGGITFSVGYSHGIKIERTFWKPIKEFRRFFEIIRKMLLSDEETPECVKRYEKF